MDYKLKYYLGLYLFLKHENLLSMSLDVDFKENLKRSFNLKESRFNNLLTKVDGMIDYDSCDIYLQFKE